MEEDFGAKITLMTPHNSADPRKLWTRQQTNAAKASSMTLNQSEQLEAIARLEAARAGEELDASRYAEERRVRQRMIADNAEYYAAKRAVDRDTKGRETEVVRERYAEESCARERVMERLLAADVDGAAGEPTPNSVKLSEEDQLKLVDRLHQWQHTREERVASAHAQVENDLDVHVKRAGNQIFQIVRRLSVPSGAKRGDAEAENVRFETLLRPLQSPLGAQWRAAGNLTKNHERRVNETNSLSLTNRLGSPPRTTSTSQGSFLQRSDSDFAKRQKSIQQNERRKEEMAENYPYQPQIISSPFRRVQRSKITSRVGLDHGVERDMGPQAPPELAVPIAKAIIHAAWWVAHHGAAFEEVIKAKNLGNAAWAFLFDDGPSDGSDYYEERLFFERKLVAKKHVAEQKKAMKPSREDKLLQRLSSPLRETSGARHVATAEWARNLRSGAVGSRDVQLERQRLRPAEQARLPSRTPVSTPHANDLLARKQRRAMKRSQSAPRLQVAESRAGWLLASAGDPQDAEHAKQVLIRPCSDADVRLPEPRAPPRKFELVVAANELVRTSTNVVAAAATLGQLIWAVARQLGLDPRLVVLWHLDGLDAYVPVNALEQLPDRCKVWAHPTNLKEAAAQQHSIEKRLSSPRCGENRCRTPGAQRSRSAYSWRGAGRPKQPEPAPSSRRAARSAQRGRPPSLRMGSAEFERLRSPTRDRMKEYDRDRAQRIAGKKAKSTADRASRLSSRTPRDDSSAGRRQARSSSLGLALSPIPRGEAAQTDLMNAWCCDWCGERGPERYNGPHGPATLCRECGVAFHASWKQAQTARMPRAGTEQTPFADTSDIGGATLPPPPSPALSEHQTSDSAVPTNDREPKATNHPTFSPALDLRHTVGNTVPPALPKSKPPSVNRLTSPPKPTGPKPMELESVPMPKVPKPAAPKPKVPKLSSPKPEISQSVPPKPLKSKTPKGKKSQIAEEAAQFAFEAAAAAAATSVAFTKVDGAAARVAIIGELGERPVAEEHVAENTTGIAKKIADFEALESFLDDLHSRADIMLGSSSQAVPEEQEAFPSAQVVGIGRTEPQPLAEHTTTGDLLRETQGGATQLLGIVQPPQKATSHESSRVATHQQDQQRKQGNGSELFKTWDEKAKQFEELAEAVEQDRPTSNGRDAIDAVLGQIDATIGCGDSSKVATAIAAAQMCPGSDRLSGPLTTLMQYYENMSANDEQNGTSEETEIVATLSPDKPPKPHDRRRFSVDAEFMAVKCPAGVTPGETLYVTTPDGDELEVVVPEGVGEGDEFDVSTIDMIGGAADEASVEGLGPEVEAGLREDVFDMHSLLAGTQVHASPSGGPRRRFSIALSKGALDGLAQGENMADVDAVLDVVEMDDADAEFLTVTCPAGVSPGETLYVTTPDGDELEVIVPEGVGEGDEFDVSIKIDAYVEAEAHAEAVETEGKRQQEVENEITAEVADDPVFGKLLSMSDDAPEPAIEGGLSEEVFDMHSLLAGTQAHASPSGGPRRRFSIALSKGALDGLAQGENMADVDAVLDVIEMDDADAEFLPVTCPAGVSPGETLYVTTPDGDELEVVVPEGVGEGDEFDVSIIMA
jgi:hypothetical protein